MVIFFRKKTRNWISADDVCHPARTFSQPDTHAIPRTTHHLTPSSLRVLSVSLCLQLACPLLHLSVFICRCVSLCLSLFCPFAVSVCLIFHSFSFVGLLPYGRTRRCDINQIYHERNIWSNIWQIKITEKLLAPSAGIPLTAPGVDSRCCLCVCVFDDVFVTLDGSVHGTAQNYDLSQNWLFTATYFKAFFFFSTRYFLFDVCPQKSTQSKKKGHDS